MKKYILLIFACILSMLTAYSQGKGVKIGYIDMEYILEKVPDYAEAKNQLDAKAEKWKQEIELKKIEINKLKETLKIEKVLLTKELIEEREEEIAFLNNELLDYQQKRFGPSGDLIIQKAVLIKPIQDQVFNAVQDFAEAKKFDYIFDKSSDMTMLFAAKRLDISDRIVTVLTRAEKREEMTKKQLKALEEKEKQEDMLMDNPELAEKQKLAESKKEERQKLIDQKKAAAEEKKKAFEDKRKAALEAKENAKVGTVSDNGTKEAAAKKIEDKKAEQQKKVDAANEARNKIQEERKRITEERIKALEEKRNKAIKTRDSIKKAREEKIKQK
jgi:Skp family chaperone for outer membrane proteins